MLGFNNYSLLLRNCEQVANFIYRGAWYSRQTETDAQTAFRFFYNSYVKGGRKLINHYPSSSTEFLLETSETLPLIDFTTLRSEFTINFTSSDGTGENIDKLTRVVLVLGPSGAGKSRLINVFFNAYVTESKKDVDSVSTDVKFYYGTFSGLGELGKKICFVDTIGFGDDTIYSQEELVQLLKGKVHRNVDHYNKILVVVGNRVLPAHMRSVSALLQAIGAAKNPSVHAILTFFEGQSELVQSQNISKLLKRSDVAEFLEPTDTIIGGKVSYPRCLCTGFADHAAIRDDSSKYRELHNLLIKLCMYPTEPKLPPPEFKWCRIL